MSTKTLKHLLARTALSASLMAFAGLSLAKNETSQVEGVLEQNRVVLQDGREVLQPADRVSPGDTLQYRVRYSNKGTGPATNLVITLPIPKGLEYAPVASQSAATEASLDGVRFESLPIKRLSRSADGKEALREVPLAQYRALRWQVEQLSPGKTVVFSARARVEKVPEQLASK
jgi:uncharacterized repeat protein (TIGR01451 family)